MLNTQDTPKTRDALRQRMQSVNPNSPKCPPEFKAEIDAACAHRSEVLAVQQIQRRTRRRDKIEALLERVETSVLTSDPETLTVRDYVLLIEAERKLDEYEAKLHGLFPKETIENESRNNIGNKLSDATRLLESTGETQTQIAEKIKMGHTTEAETLAKEVMSLIEVYGYEHIDYFAKTFLSHYITTDFAPLHLEILTLSRVAKSGHKKNIIAPRGSAKSTCMAVIYPLHRICYKSYDQMIGYQPDHFILILSRTYRMAVDRIKAIKYELETNETLQTAFGNLVGKTWGEKEIVTKKPDLPESHRAGRSNRGALFRNFRPSLIISDDLDDPETVTTQTFGKKICCGSIPT